MENEGYLKELQQLRNLSNSTLRRYKIDLTHYCKYTGMTLEELLNEADSEEEQRVRMRKRKIKKHLLGMQQEIIDKNFCSSTINSIMSHIKAFYRTYDIEVPIIRSQHVDQTETIEDIPTLEHIRKAANTPNLKHRAIILFLASSGTGSLEMREMTVNDFMKATKKYHYETNINNALNVLKNKKNIIPTFQMKRYKTSYHYYTFCSPEATEAIVDYLLSRENLQLEDLLFDIGQFGLVKMFRRINDRYGWGWKKTRRFFHAHSMRKFFATQLTKAKLDHLIIQWMSGRAIPPTTASYFKADPESLKKEYMKVVDRVSVSKVDIYDVKSEEFAQLENKNKELTKKQAEQDEQMKDVMLLVEKMQAQMKNHK